MELGFVCCCAFPEGCCGKKAASSPADSFPAENPGRENAAISARLRARCIACATHHYHKTMTYLAEHLLRRGYWSAPGTSKRPQASTHLLPPLF